MAWVRFLGAIAVAALAAAVLRAFPVLAPVLFVGGGIGFAVWWYRARPQQKSTALEAKRMGLRYARVDPLGIDGYPFAVLKRGEQRRIEHVLWGTWEDDPVTIFELAYADAAGTWTRLSCAFAGSPVEPPAFVLESSPLATSLPAEGLPPVAAVPDEELAELFEARCDAPGVAETLLGDGAMTAFLTGLSEPLGFELVGRTVLCYGDRREPWDLYPLVSALRTFRDRIPASIRDRYPAPSEPAAVPDATEPVEPTRPSTDGPHASAS